MAAGWMTVMCLHVEDILRYQIAVVRFQLLVAIMVVAGVRCSNGTYMVQVVAAFFY